MKWPFTVNLNDKVVVVTGAGGNNTRATTDNEYHELNGLEVIKTFFDLNQKGVNLSLI